MLSCFQDFVVLRGCYDTPEAGVFTRPLELDGYLSDHVREHFQALATKDTDNYFAIWRNVQKRALLEFKNDIMKHINTRVKLKSAGGVVQTGEFYDDITPLTGAGTRGIKLKIDNCSPMLGVRIHSIRFELLEDIQTTPSVYIVSSTGQLLYFKIFFTPPINQLTRGCYTLQINEDIGFCSNDVRELYIGVNNTGSMQLRPARLKSDIDCGCDLNFNGKGWQTSYTTGNNPFVDAQEGAVIVDWSFTCSFDNWICANRNDLLPSWITKLKIELIKTTNESVNVTKFNAMNGDWRAESLKREEEKLNDMLSTFAKNANIPRVDCCVECNVQSQKMTLL